jgi:hypothetical protein
MNCKQLGCHRESLNKVKQGFCAMHKSRAQYARLMGLAPIKRDNFMSALVSNNEIWGRLTDAALEYADADSEDDKAYQRVCNKLRLAANVYVHTRQGK